LLTKSPAAWAEHVVENFNKFLLDHASCERKAAALAMSFVAKYSDRGAIIEPMVCLAREELEHFHQVYRIIARRGLSLAETDEKDQYVNEILRSLRHGREERFLDRLVMSGIVEARGYERFHLLGEHLPDPELKKFYQKLADTEAGHYQIFIRLAKHYFSEPEVAEAVDRIAKVESAAMIAAPIKGTLH
jgi:tRNA-(ms[2]io[6]A)-hydroxylase